MDSLLEFLGNNPYPAIFGVMILCGLGLPIPEEVVLVCAGYLTYQELAQPKWIYLTCILSILAGDLIPFLLGKLFGPKMLKLRLVRTYMNTERLARFDAFFSKHGRITILIARFLAGVRTPAFFTAGSMGMGIFRFLLMDGIGALIGCAFFVTLGFQGGQNIDHAIDWIQRTERGLTIVIGAAALILCAWLYYAHRRKQRLLGKDVRETFVEPSLPPEGSIRPEKPSEPRPGEEGEEEPRFIHFRKPGTGS